MNAANGSSKLSSASLTAFHEQSPQLDRALRHYDYHVDEVLSDPRVSRRSARFLERTWYAPPRNRALSMAQRDLREALTRATMLTLLHHAAADGSASAGPTRLGMLSTCPSSGYSDYGAGRVRFGRVKQHFLRCMRRRSFQGLGFLDFALVHDHADTSPTELGLHFHGICRPVGSPRVIMGDGRIISPSRRQNKHGLAAARMDVQPSPLTPWNIVQLGYYASKISCGLKQQSSRATRTSQQLWSSCHVLRALELYSHLSPSEALAAIGPLGKALKSDCEDRVSRMLKLNVQTQLDIDHDQIERSWQRLYQDLELAELRPIRVKWH